jgi:hypothetical protein
LEIIPAIYARRNAFHGEFSLEPKRNRKKSYSLVTLRLKAVFNESGARSPIPISWIGMREELWRLPVNLLLLTRNEHREDLDLDKKDAFQVNAQALG